MIDFCKYLPLALMNGLSHLLFKKHSSRGPLLSPPSHSSSCYSSSHLPPRGCSPHQASPFPGASSLLRIKCISHWGLARQPSTLFVPGALDCPVHVPGEWFSLWKQPGVWVSWDYWSSYGIILPFNFFNSSPNSTIGVQDFSSTVRFRYPLLFQSAAKRASQRTTMPGSCLCLWWLPTSWKARRL